jgi:DNA-binding LacI/PurR family transcriptional regulator/DNA-binding transcriptional regulator YhcF (GntR family)
MSSFTAMDAISKQTYPSRKAFIILRRQLEEQLAKGAYSAGDRFPSDAELVRITGLSRDTVRKALTELSRDGWIERRHGLGTFVGPRASLPVHRSIERGMDRSRMMGRVAVLGTWFWRQEIGWYTAGIMEGMENAAEEARVSIEFLGNRGVDSLSVCRRLAQTRPDVLVCLLPRGEHAMILAEAHRLEIPTLMTGTRLSDIGVPTVREDDAQGARLAVDRLVKAGHKRIGLLAWTEGGAWIFERRRGYLQGLKAAGIEHDERLTLWLERDKPAATPADAEVLGLQNAQIIDRYIRANGPTALVITASGITIDLSILIRRGQLRVPEDISIVQFDQAFSLPVPELPNPTCIALPVREMGQQLIHLARRAINQEDVGVPEPIPCTLVEGSSVAEVAR